MEAFSFWKGRSFCLLEYLSLLSTSVNTGFSRFTLYYDEHDHPDNHFWHLADEIPRICKVPAAKLLNSYLARFLTPRVAPITDVRILADIFRYAHLYDNGGAWLDLDTFQVKDLTRLMAQRDFTAGWESSDYINIAILGFPAGHPILAALLDALAGTLEGNKRPFHVIGPRLMTRIVKRQGRENEVLGKSYFYPVGYHLKEEVLFGNYPLPDQTHSIHVWAYLNRKYFEHKSLGDFADEKSTFFDQVRNLMQLVPQAVSPTIQ